MQSADKGSYSPGRPPAKGEERCRIASVGYLNSAPYRALNQLPWVQYDECLPAECARRLIEGEAELALIPFAEAVCHGGLSFLDYGIIGRGVVGSVLVLSELPIDQLDTILLDSGSMSSVALLRIVLFHRYPELNKRVKFSRLPAGEALRRIGGKTGALVIGDQAIRHRDGFLHRLDLGQAWQELVLKTEPDFPAVDGTVPFLFAVWAFRAGTVSSAAAAELTQQIESGLRSLRIYAIEWAADQGIPQETALRYMEHQIGHRIDEAALAAAQLYIRLGVEAGIFPQIAWVEEREAAGKGEANPSPAKTFRCRPLDSILDAAASGRRISLSEGLALAESATLADLALAADLRRKQLHPDPRVSYIVDRNINYTNVCNVYCRFCAFYRAPGKQGGYILTKDEIGRKIAETVEAGGIQILLQGGLNPELGIEYYEDLFSWIKANYPVNLHALSADEILHIAKVSNLTLDETFSRLIRSGLGSLPGAGAELLVDRVRWRIARLKTNSAQWLDVHRAAHRFGLTSTVTMMFGVQESWEDRLIHLQKTRQLQDETGGVTAFITWSFQEENTKLKKGNTSATEYLRVQAISRLFLDNIANIQSSWVTQGPSVGQLAL